MDESKEKTAAIKHCAACDSGLLESDRFCRWCGVAQPDTNAGLSIHPRAYKTSRLATVAREQVYHRVSAPLVEAVVTSALASQAIGPESRLVKRLILSLISIPIWLMIVLLSPVDAYATVRNLARQS